MTAEKSSGFRYPVAFCPGCHRAILYSDDPRERISLCFTEPGRKGKSILCSKCKRMLSFEPAEK